MPCIRVFIFFDSGRRYFVFKRTGKQTISTGNVLSYAGFPSSPGGCKKIIYLDPDILIINPLRPLWETDLKGYLFAAAAHSGKTELVHSVNRVRLKTQHDYYNSGVLLMDLAAGRREIIPEQLFIYAKEHASELLLPDQDMLNTFLWGSYWKNILQRCCSCWRGGLYFCSFPCWKRTWQEKVFGKPFPRLLF